MVVNHNGVEDILAFRYIQELYINKTIDISIKECVRLSKIFSLFVTDYHGYILAEVKSYEKI